MKMLNSMNQPSLFAGQMKIIAEVENRPGKDKKLRSLLWADGGRKQIDMRSELAKGILLYVLSAPMIRDVP